MELVLTPDEPRGGPSVTIPYVARFVGGPLDGREEIWSRPIDEARPTITHVHLHDGPKIEHHYDLHHSDQFGWEYRLRES